VEEELRHAERQQQRSSGEFAGRAVLEGEEDLLVPCAIDLRAWQALDKIDRCRDPRFEFGDIGLGYREDVRLASGQQRAGNYSVAVGLAGLTRQIIHRGCEPQVEQDRGIDVFRLRVRRCVVQQDRQIAQIRHEDIDRRFAK